MSHAWRTDLEREGRSKGRKSSRGGGSTRRKMGEELDWEPRVAHWSSSGLLPAYGGEQKIRGHQEEILR